MSAQPNSARTAVSQAASQTTTGGLKRCCTSGVKHEGTTVGAVKNVGGVETYVTLPPGNYDTTKAVIYLTDVFGINGNLPNNLLLADSFAARGFAVYMPDILNRDAIPASAMNDPSLNLNDWFSRHGPETTKPALHKLVAALRAQGVTSIAAVAYCFGARSAVDLLTSGTITCAAIAHPSLLTPADLEATKRAGRPVLWNLAEHDEYFTREMRAVADGVFGQDGRFERRVWEGTGHGFATRGNPRVGGIRKAKEGAFEASVEWMGRYL